MRFAVILATLAVAVTAVPTSSSAFDGAGPALGKQTSLISHRPSTRPSCEFVVFANGLLGTAARDACKDIDGYEECVNNCSALEPGFACTIACLISQCA